jgi:prolyl 4-hydroxylase
MRASLHASKTTIVRSILGPVLCIGPFFVHEPAMQKDFVAAADAMLATGRKAEAIALIARATTEGDVNAPFQLAIWLLAGAVLPRDLPQARKMLRLAVERGHKEARLIEIALVANGTGAAPDWQQAIRLLNTACAANDQNALQIVELLSAMNLTESGEPRAVPALQPLVSDGSIRLAPGLLSAAECAHLAHSAADLLAPAVVADPRTGRMVPHPIRTSDAATISPVREDPVIRAINARIASISGTKIEQGEALTILRYKPGQQFRLHSDVLPNVGNQRIVTVLVYLNDGFEGGETLFPEHGLIIRPKAGDAVIFDNATPDQKPIAASCHAGAPVISGVKWLATRWIRARSFDVWQGPESPHHGAKK